MSMMLVLAMVSPDVEQRIVESKGELWAQLWDGSAQVEFARDTDLLSDLDYRDLLPEVEEETHLLYRIFQSGTWGRPLIEGYEWTYGPPTWFEPREVKTIHAELNKLDESWPISEIVEFFGRAAEADKGVILGVR